jgi:hypothetical protein
LSSACAALQRRTSLAQAASHSSLERRRALLGGEGVDSRRRGRVRVPARRWRRWWAEPADPSGGRERNDYAPLLELEYLTRVQALQALRGASLIKAAALVADVGSFEPTIRVS